MLRSQLVAVERLFGMDTADPRFDQLRPRLMGIAYRMLGSTGESEEVVQDAWLRWHDAAHERIDNLEAWLVTVTTRLAIDRLRVAKLQREHYVGTRSEEHTSELQSLMRISYAVFCLKKKKT